jgi:hypothetical protein
MRNQTGILGLAAVVAVALLQGCETSLPSQEQPSAPLARVERLDLDLCAPAGGGFTAGSSNQFFPLPVGRQWVFDGEEGGVPIHLEIEVLRQKEVVAGVTTRVVEEREWEGGELLEVSHNFYAQAGDGTVCYFGEAVDIYEGGVVVSHAGAWRADDPGNRPGIIMPAEPRINMRFQMEGAPGVAEDEGTIVGTGPAVVPAGRFTQTIRVREYNPLDGGKGYKVFAANVGLIVDGPVALVSY